MADPGNAYARFCRAKERKGNPVRRRATKRKRPPGATIAPRERALQRPPFPRRGRVSVLMSAYRTAPFLVHSVKSCLSQALPKGWTLEVLVGVDACQDTLAAAHKLPRDSRLRVLAMPKNVGTYRTLNALYAASSGEVIAVLDSDDLMKAGRLRTQVEVLGKGFDFVGSLYEVEREGHVRDGPRVRPRGSLKEMTYPLHSTWAVRRWVYARLGGYSEWRCGADTEFTIGAVAAGAKLRVIQKVLTRRRERPGQLTAVGTSTGPGTPARTAAQHKVNAALASYRRGTKPPVKRRPPVSAKIHRGRPRVAILIPTIPRRVAACQRTVSRFLAQEGVDLVVLHLNGHASAPPWTEHPRIKAVTQPAGTGPIVRWSEIPDADFVLGADDDLLYPTNYVSRTVASLLWVGRGNVLSYHATHWPAGTTALERRVILDFAQAADRFVPKTYMGSGASAFFGDDLRRMQRCRSRIFNRLDDVWISSAASRAGLKIYRPPSPQRWISALPEQHDGIFKAEVQEAFASRKTAIATARRLGNWPLTPTHPPILKSPW